MIPDTFYLQNRIQLEINNLNRGHVYYSIDEQPEVCARLIAQGCWLKFYPMYYAKLWQEVEGEIVKEEIYTHRVSVTVQSWEDVPAAIGLIRERQREFKKGAGR
jgi:hypothetical protein